MWRVFSTVVKVAVASLIVGTVLAHFGITADQVLKDFGITPERLARAAAPGLRLGACRTCCSARSIIVPVWLLVFLFRPPGSERVAHDPEKCEAVFG